MKRVNINIPSCCDCANSKGVLCALSKENKEFLSDKKGHNFYKKGQAIFYEGNSANGLYCINKGRVKLSKLGEDGKDQIVRFAKEGDILGYRSLLSNEAYQATATAMDDCYICLVSKDKFNELIEKDPRLSVSVIQLLSRDLRSAEQLLVNIAQKSVKERISEAIVVLKRTFGFRSDNKTLDVVLTRSEIADMAGTTTETTIRTLSQLSNEGPIELVGKTIVINDFKKLLLEAGLFD